jgi:hypothetical protein
VLFGWVDWGSLGHWASGHGLVWALAAAQIVSVVVRVLCVWCPVGALPGDLCFGRFLCTTRTATPAVLSVPRPACSSSEESPMTTYPETIMSDFLKPSTRIDFTKEFGTHAAHARGDHLQA